MDTTFLTLSIILGQLLKLSIGISGGLTILDITVVILCIWGLLRSKLYLKTPPLWIKFSLAFILVALLSLILTPLALTPSEYFTSVSYTLRFFLYIFLGWLIYSGFFPNFKKSIYQILFISGLIFAILGVFQFILLPDLKFLTQYGWDPHYFRTVSTFFDPNFTGAFLVLTLLLLYKNFLGITKREINKLRVFEFALLYITLLTTFSRSGYGMFFVSFFLLGILLKNIRVCLVAIVLTSGLLFGFYVYSTAVSQPLNIDRTASATSRLSSWQHGWKIFASSPILGVGYNTYRFALKQYQLAPEEVIQSRGGSTNDSSLLFVAATTGIIGLFTYLGFLISIFIKGLKENKILSVALFGLIAHSTFANSLFYPHLLIWIILFAATLPRTPLEKA